MIQRALVLAVFGVALTLAASSRADPRRTPTKGAIQVPDVVITARPRAIVSIDIARMRHEIASVQLREPFTTRVESAAYKEPF